MNYLWELRRNNNPIYYQELIINFKKLKTLIIFKIISRILFSLMKRMKCFKKYRNFEKRYLNMSCYGLNKLFYSYLKLQN